MILTDYLLCQKSIQWQYAKQMGIDHAVIRLPEDNQFDLNDKTHWETIYKRFRDEGLKPIVIEPMPEALHAHIKTGDERRDECIDKVIGMLPIMDALDIRTICFNFMAHIGWYRSSSDIKERGGALVTGFDIDEFKAEDDFIITEKQLWDNLAYFLNAVVPYAEKYNIRLALHPDDPPVPRLGGVSRILTSSENISKAIHIVRSDNLGITMCQATYAAMGENLEEAIPAFARDGKLFFAHFRDISGNKYKFRETFHDNGQTDMAKIIRIYDKCSCHVPIRVDHVPTMAGEDNNTPGYAIAGRLYAIGYLKGLMDGRLTPAD